jgi:hypothetical protein
MSFLYMVASHYFGLLQDGDGGRDNENRTAGNEDIAEEDWDHVRLEDYVEEDGDDVKEAGDGKLTTGDDGKEGDSHTQDHVDKNSKDKAGATTDTNGEDVRSASNSREEAGKGKAKEGVKLQNVVVVDDDVDDGLFQKEVTQQGGQVNAPESRLVKETTSANGVRILPAQRPCETRPRPPVGICPGGQCSRYRRIGSGRCGNVFEDVGSGIVVKVARQHVACNMLSNDRICHIMVQDAFSRHQDVKCQPTRIHKYVRGKYEPWWEHNGPLLFEKHDTPGGSAAKGALLTQRIWPVPRGFREGIIALFSSSDGQEYLIRHPKSSDGLLHVHLGRRGSIKHQDRSGLSLRDFKLNLDQMFRADLPAPEYAAAVGEALAVMHWSAGLDGDGVKFVLGNETDPDARDNRSGEASGSTAGEGVKGTSRLNDIPRLWIFGFDSCSRFESIAMPDEPEKLLAYLCDAFRRNNAYYPHPRPVDARGRAVWHMFRDAYLDRSGRCLVDRGQAFWWLPSEFLRQVTQISGRPGTPEV